MELKRKSLPVYHCKVVDEAEGIVEAIVSVFDVVDSYNERTKPGCFEKSLREKLPKVLWMHDGKRPIGKTLEAEELAPGDARLPDAIREYGGLWVRGQLILEVQDGRDALSHLKFGSVDEFSIGYYEIKTAQAKDGVIDLLALKLVEWSPVLVGANPATALLGAKGQAALLGLAVKASASLGIPAPELTLKQLEAFLASPEGEAAFFAGEDAPDGDGAQPDAVPSEQDSPTDGIAENMQGRQSAAARPCNGHAAAAAGGAELQAKAEYLGSYAEGRACMSALYSLADALFYNAFYDCVYGDGEVSERLAVCEAALGEFQTLTLKILTAILSGMDDAESGEKAAQIIRACTPPPGTKDAFARAAGVFAQQLDAARAAVEDCIRRAGAIHALRAKDGRALSAERREQLTGLKDALSGLLSACGTANGAACETALEQPEADAARAATLRQLERKARLRAAAVGVGDN